MKIAFPIHPEFRTLPMMWYVPPLSPVQSQIDQGNLPTEVDGKPNTAALEAVALSEAQAEAMYQMLGIANFEDRFVIPISHEEMAQEDPYAFQGQNGFAPGNISSQGSAIGQGFTLFPTPRKRSHTPQGIVPRKKG